MEASKARQPGAIVRSRRWVIVAIACLLALALHLGLTEYGTQTIVTYCDQGPATIEGPAGDPLIPRRNVMADTFCMSPAPAGQRTVAAFHARSGLFPRVTAPLAVGGGVILPLLLVCLAGYAALDTARGRTRTVLAAILVLGGSLAAAGAAYGLWKSRAWHEMWQDSQAVAGLGLFAVPAAILLGAGIWLWRTRSPKEPA